MSSEFVLYRFFDDADRLLYVGKSVNVWSRFTSHRRESAFYPQAANVTLQRGFSSEAELVEAEIAAIRSEHPRYNIAYNYRTLAPTAKPRKLAPRAKPPIRQPKPPSGPFVGPQVNPSTLGRRSDGRVELQDGFECLCCPECGSEHPDWYPDDEYELITEAGTFIPICLHPWHHPDLERTQKLRDPAALRRAEKSLLESGHLRLSAKAIARRELLAKEREALNKVCELIWPKDDDGNYMLPRSNDRASDVARPAGSVSTPAA